MYHNIYKSTTRTPHHHLPSSIVEHSSGGIDASSVVQRGAFQKLVEMKKTPTASKGIMQAFTHSGILYVSKSRNKLKFEDNIIILYAEACTPL